MAAMVQRPSTTEVVGIYIDVSRKAGIRNMRMALVEATQSGTLIVSGSDTACRMRVILSHLSRAELDLILDGVTPHREIA